MILNENCIVFDTETTGLYAGEDEILQLSIINGNGDVLFNEYIKPSRRKKWTDAQRIHHISPQTVKNCKTFRHYKKQIQEIFDSVNIIIAYNAVFDIRFLNAVGIDTWRITKPHEKDLIEFALNPEKKITLDPMIDFAEIYGEFSEYHNAYKWQKLTTAARYYGYQFNAHDSLEDVRATLHVAKEIYKDK